MQIIRRSILIVVCIAVLLSSFIVPSFAVSTEPDPNMLDMGWLYDNGDYYLPGDFQLPSFLVSDEPNYPDFDPNDIPWEEAPAAVKEILYNTPFISTSTMDYINPWKIPFVLVITNGTVVRVFVGINLMLATYYSSNDDLYNGIPTGSYVVCEVLTSSGTVKTGVDFACCYEAVFDYDTMNMTTSWHTPEKFSVGDRFTRFSGNFISLTSAYDYYCYGGNNIGPGKSSVAIHIYTSNNSSYNSSGYPLLFAVSNASGGFTAGSGSFIYNELIYFNSYFEAFVPATAEQRQHETSKGIWESIKSLPSAIANAIKSFFTNLGDRISGFFDNLKNYLLYFQPTEPEHINPFGDVLKNIKSFFDDQMSDVGDFKKSLNSTLSNVVQYIESGSGIINSFLTAVPLLSAFVTFFVVFCIVRKVVGR